MHPLIRNVVVAGLCITASAMAANVSLSGYVMNSGNAPVKNALVRLKNANLSAQTDNDGRYSITGTPNKVLQFGVGERRSAIRLEANGAIRVTIASDHEFVRICLIDLQGRVIRTIASGFFNKGPFGNDVLARGALSHKVYILSMQVGGEKIVCKFVPSGSGSVCRVSGKSSNASGLLKLAGQTALDTLEFIKADYDTLRLPVTSFAAAPKDSVTIKRSPGTANISLSGTLHAAPLAKTRAGSALNGNLILAVPTIRGSIDFMNFSGTARWLPVDSNGTFNIELPKQIMLPWPTDAMGDVEWVLALIDTTKPTREEQFISFVSISDPAGSLLRLPVDKGIDDIGMGVLQKSGDEAQSSVPLDSSASKFSLTSTQLRDIAKTDNAGKMIKNAFVNFDRTTGFSFPAEPAFVFNLDSLGLIYNRYPDPSEYFNREIVGLTVQIEAYDSLLFDKEAFCDRTQTIDLYPPAPIHMGSPTRSNANDTSWYCAYFPVFISSDSARNHAANALYPNYNPQVSLPGCGQAQDQAPTMWVGDMHGDIAAGPWLYKKNRDTVFAKYDYSLSLPFDSTGKPFVFVPSIKLVVDTATGIVDSLATKWFEYNTAQGKYIEVTDMPMLKNSVSWFVINPYSSGSSNRSLDYGKFDTLSFNMHQKFPNDTVSVKKDDSKRIQGITVQFITCGVHISIDWRLKYQ